MRSTLSGNLTVGAITIPVRLYSASEKSSVDFHQVHKEDKGRVKHVKVCTVCEKPLSSEDICKGYEVAGQVVTFTNEELDALKPMTGRGFRLVGFVNRAEIPDIVLDKPHFIGTENAKKGGVGQPFTLLHRAMVQSGKVGLVSWVARSSESIGMLVPYGRGFMLKRILYANKVRSIEEVEVLEAEIPDALVAKGVQLIEKLTIEFDHEKFEESYSESIKKIIEARAMGEEIPIEVLAPKTEEKSLEALMDQALA